MTSNDRPKAVLDRYALFDAVARGGMATVHIGRLAGAGGFSKTVAIKRMHEHLANNADFIDMFVDEARLAGRIQHPNVANVLDVVARDHEAFLVLEYVDGESLSTLLKKIGSDGELMPIEISVQIVREALLGLHAAHEATDEKGESLQIVHRDVSPQNILVGGDGVSRVLDFGIAKAVGRVQDSTTGQLKGKISYMGPEQVVGHAVDRRVDIYAAGVVLWEALAGRRLFSGANSAELVYRILEEEIPAVSTVREEVSPELSNAIAKATSRARDDRFNTAQEFAAELERCAGIISQSRVGEFVQRIGGEQLQKRRTRIRAIEALSLDDVGDMPSGEELAARASSHDFTQSLIVGNPGEETIVDRPVTATQTLADPPSRKLPVWLIGVAAAGVAAGVALATTVGGPQSGGPNESEPESGAARPEEPGESEGSSGSQKVPPQKAAGRDDAAAPSEEASKPTPPPVDNGTTDDDAAAPDKSEVAVSPTPAPPQVRPRPRPAPRPKPVRAEDLFSRE